MLNTHSRNDRSQLALCGEAGTPSYAAKQWTSSIEAPFVDGTQAAPGGSRP